MGFRNSTSFPRFDTSVVDVEGERIIINHDVPKRCRNVYTFMVGEVKKVRKEYLKDQGSFLEVDHCFVSGASIISYMKWLDPTLTTADVNYALRKLIKDLVIAKADPQFQWRGESTLYRLLHDPKHYRMSIKK